MTTPVRIPADVDMHDRILGPLTARQLGILAVTGLALYATWTAIRSVVPVTAFLAAAAPVAAAAAVLALGQRDGVSMDRLALAAIRQRLAPRRYSAAAEEAAPTPQWLTDTIARNNALQGRRRSRADLGPVANGSPLPARQVAPTDSGHDIGVIDLGPDGLAVVAAASTVNFALRTPEEQDSLVALFGRYLHSLTAPVQILVRAHRLDLSEQIAELRDRASALPHPALRSAALDHAGFLADLDRNADLLRRQILLVLREPIGPTTAALGSGGLGRSRGKPAQSPADDTARRAAQARLARRVSEAVDLLAPAGITVTPLTAGQATAVLRTACNPDSLLPPTAALAAPGHVITGQALTAESRERWDEPAPPPTPDTARRDTMRWAS